MKIGTYDNIVSVTESTSIKTAFQLLLEKDISALPILDENKKLLDVYAKYEVLNLVSEKIYSDLSVTIGEVRNKKKDWEEKLQKCRSSITLYEALEVIVRTESHRLLLVDKEDKLIGIVSLSDILVYLNRIIPTEKKVSSLQELFKPLEENKVTESVKETENEDIVLEVPVLNSTSNGPNKIIAEVSEEIEDEKANTKGVLESDGTEIQNDVTDCTEIEHASNNTDSDIESSLNIEPIELHISE